MRFLHLALLSLAASGCVSVKQIPIDSSAASSLSGRSVVITQRPKPSFSAMTPGKAMFGAIGAAATISAGNKIIQENSVEDPADDMAKRISTILHAKTGVEVQSGLVPVVTGKREALMNAGPDLVLDVMTINWSVVYFPSDWSHYRLIYTARATLLDGKNKSVIAEGSCSRVPEKTDNAPSYEELLANGAARLKQELAVAEEACVSEFSEKTFKL